MFLDLDSWFVGKVFTTRLPRNASMKTLKKKKEKKNAWRKPVLSTLTGG